MFFSILNAAIFIFLALLHIYWLMGGKLWSQDVVPTIEGKDLFQPGRLATIIVSCALFFFALIHLSLFLDFGLFTLPTIRWCLLAIASIFFLRAMGDFRYLGFFKKMKDTPFAMKDSKFYSPLSFVISINSFLLYSFY